MSWEATSLRNYMQLNGKSLSLDIYLYKNQYKLITPCYLTSGELKMMYGSQQGKCQQCND